MFFDIGANIGRWSLENLNNCNKIIAIESSPDTFKKLISKLVSPLLFQYFNK